MPGFVGSKGNGSPPVTTIVISGGSSKELSIFVQAIDSDPSEIYRSRGNDTATTFGSSNRPDKCKISSMGIVRNAESISSEVLRGSI